MNMFRSFLFVSVLGLLSGCVSKPVEAEDGKPALPLLMIAQNGDGDVTIEWESRPGFFYTIYYQVAADTDWKVLRKARRMPGTGQTLTAYDRVNPNRPLRRYRVLPEEQ